MGSLPAKDRRRAERRWTAVPVLIRNGESEVEGVSINVSQAGMYFFAAADLAVGTQIEVEFCPRDSKEKVRAYAVVRRRALYLYGIEFLAPDVSEAGRRASSQDYSPLRDGSA